MTEVGSVGETSSPVFGDSKMIASGATDGSTWGVLLQCALTCRAFHVKMGTMLEISLFVARTRGMNYDGGCADVPSLCIWAPRQIPLPSTDVREVSGNVRALHVESMDAAVSSGTVRTMFGAASCAAGGPSSVDPASVGDSQVGT